MKIVYPPSPKTKLLIKEINKLLDKGYSGNQAAKHVGYSREYVYALIKWDKEQKEKKV